MLLVWLCACSIAIIQNWNFDYKWWSRDWNFHPFFGSEHISPSYSEIWSRKTVLGKFLWKISNLVNHVHCTTVAKIWSNICEWSSGWFDQLEVAVYQWKTSQTCELIMILWYWSTCNFQVLIFTDIDYQVQVALDSNLRSAILCALLCMKSSRFSAEELYMTITSLSYQGATKKIIIATLVLSCYV